MCQTLIEYITIVRQNRFFLFEKDIIYEYIWNIFDDSINTYVRKPFRNKLEILILSVESSQKIKPLIYYNNDKFLKLLRCVIFT